MAEGFLKSFDKNIDVFSAGTKPAESINPNTVIVMKEDGIDVSGQFPKDVRKFANDSFDYVITVCDNAKVTGPVFSGKVGKRIHLAFVDPADAKGTHEEILNEYREVRDEIKRNFRQLLTKFRD